MGRIRIEGIRSRGSAESVDVAEAAIRARYGGGEVSRRVPGEPRVVDGSTATQRVEIGGRSYEVPNSTVAVRRGGSTATYHVEKGQGVETR